MTLLERIAAHIPSDAPALSGYVPGYYLQCYCDRTPEIVCNGYGRMTGHPKPWQDNDDDPRDIGHEGYYCLSCATKVWDAVFGSIDGVETGICRFANEEHSAPGYCIDCGIALDGEPEDMQSEIQHYQQYPPSSVTEWQEFHRFVEMFEVPADVIAAIIDAAECVIPALVNKPGVPRQT